jgi:hypothetical protein
VGVGDVDQARRALDRGHPRHDGHRQRRGGTGVAGEHRAVVRGQREG